MEKSCYKIFINAITKGEKKLCVIWSIVSHYIHLHRNLWNIHNCWIFNDVKNILMHTFVSFSTLVLLLERKRKSRWKIYLLSCRFPPLKKYSSSSTSSSACSTSSSSPFSWWRFEMEKLWQRKELKRTQGVIRITQPENYISGALFKSSLRALTTCLSFHRKSLAGRCIGWCRTLKEDGIKKLFN